MKGIKKHKLLAVSLALLIAAGGIPRLPLAQLAERPALTAQAADPETPESDTGSAELNEGTGVLTLSGAVTKDMIWDAVGKAGDWDEPEKTVTAVAAE